MREELLDILERLLSVHENLGEHTFRQACHLVRRDIAATALEEAHRRAGYTPPEKRSVNHDESK